MKPNQKARPYWKVPLLGVLAVIMILGMLRLGFWQLGRAAEKQATLDQLQSLSTQSPRSLFELDKDALAQRFTPVVATGTFAGHLSILVDRQVVNGQVGYQVFTPLILSDQNRSILVARGWVSAGASRSELPEIETPSGLITVRGRLNRPPAKPPLWDESFPVNDGRVWQYLPVEEYATQMRLNLYPLVIELAPETAPPIALTIDWPAINDQWVAKHQGYAFQWFAMAFAFFIACLLLLIRFLRRTEPEQP